MNSRGHHRVAARVLTALGMEPPAEWWSLPALPEASADARSAVLPGARRARGCSAG